MAPTLQYVINGSQPVQKISQKKWQRVILLAVLLYEALGCLLGGALLVAAPDGRLMDMPVTLMHGTFADFLIPGIILFGLGILNTVAFITALRKTNGAWITTGIALGGLAIWFWIEIAILQQLHWLHAMWGLPVVLGIMVAIPLIPNWSIIRNVLLVCGILSSLLYGAINIIVAMQWPAYNSMSQTVSELSAIGAPTRTLWIFLCTPYTIFMVAFAWGVLKSTGNNRRLRIAGKLLMAYAALGLLWPFVPMHLRETLATGGETFSDTMHITLGVVTEIIYVLALVIASTAFGKRFRLYSIITLIALLIFGVLTFLDAPNIATNQPTPLIGLWERINIGIFSLWVVVLAVILIKTNRSETIRPDTVTKSLT